MGLDANAKLGGHSDGFRVGYAVPHDDMTAGDEERANFFVNYITKNCLAAQNKCTQEENGTNTRYWAFSRLDTGGLCFDIRKQSKPKAAESKKTRS